MALELLAISIKQKSEREAVRKKRGEERNQADEKEASEAVLEKEAGERVAHNGGTEAIQRREGEVVAQEGALVFPERGIREQRREEVRGG
jgi:hypothetical protein